MQAFVAQEEGDRKQHIHAQCAAVLVLAPAESLKRDLTALLRLLCGFRTNDSWKWAMKVELHFAESAMQPGLRKVTLAGLFGYCVKQRYTSSVYKCAPTFGCAGELAQVCNCSRGRIRSDASV